MDVKIKSSDVWTWLLVTVVSIMIWIWAAGETREEAGASMRIRIVPPDESEWIVSPREFTANVEMTGSRFAIQNARNLRMPLELRLGTELPAATGVYNSNVASLLDRHPPLRRTGVQVLSADPSSREITVDRVEEVTTNIKAVLPRLQTEGDVVVIPAQATVRMPARLREVVGDDFFVEAVIDQQLEPGRFYSPTVRLRLPPKLAGETSVTIDPPSATVEFTVRSRIEQLTLQGVNVQIAGPWKDHEEYVVEIDERDQQVQNVTIRADGELIKKIQANEVPVFALVHLSNYEKSQRIESKPVTCFVAVPPAGPATVVEAEVPDEKGMPEIRLRITPRPKAP